MLLPPAQLLVDALGGRRKGQDRAADGEVTHTQVKTCCIVNMGVILSTLVATLLHTTAITRDIPGCELNTPYQLRPEWCSDIENKMLSNGLDSMFVIFCLLEFCAAVAALAFGYNAVKQHNYTRMKKQLRRVEKRDTLALLQKTPVRRKAATE
ncbi:membrane-spanning 4-domains subfamily a member 15-like [Limosa lapponica baueri]|uniref:Membrane-spanning 4-domains subfamily a member 15-like n=1 Tax=Limosa lapponica baueri TaxID=1758121 RepID=A0A2I0TBZ4_LIMLA|nr:membrane-spanning 4-domains subfamily a member 15-like [Limosa lapponica baueri]